MKKISISYSKKVPDSVRTFVDRFDMEDECGHLIKACPPYEVTGAQNGRIVSDRLFNSEEDALDYIKRWSDHFKRFGKARVYTLMTNMYWEEQLSDRVLIHQFKKIEVFQ